jgi:hypothetical protein
MKRLIGLCRGLRVAELGFINRLLTVKLNIGLYYTDLLQIVDKC